MESEASHSVDVVLSETKDPNNQFTQLHLHVASMFNFPPQIENLAFQNKIQLMENAPLSKLICFEFQANLNDVSLINLDDAFEKFTGPLKTLLTDLNT